MSDSGAELDVIHPTPASNSGSPQTFQETTSLADLTSYQMDEDYYIESTFMIFQVENCLFRVPTYIFVEAPVFAGMFKLPQSGINTEGSSSDNPIMFPSNILSVDFENLLEALFPLQVSLKLSLTTPKWISVLKLSNTWFIARLRALAIFELNRLNEISSIQKVQLGRDQKVSKWVVEGFKELISASSPITIEDAIDLDIGSIATTYRLCRIRERRLLRTVSSVSREIEDAFREELHEIRTHEEAFREAVPNIPFQVPDPFEPPSLQEDPAPAVGYEDDYTFSEERAPKPNATDEWISPSVYFDEPAPAPSSASKKKKKK